MKKGLFKLQYELDSRYTEAGSDQGAKLDVHEIDDENVRRFLSDTAHLGYKETVKYLKQRQEQSDSSIAIIPFTTATPEALAYRLENLSPRLTFLSRPLNTVERLDEMLYAANWRLPQGAYLCAHSMTAALKRNLTMARYPWGINYLMVAWDYVWHRMCPKMRLTRRLYFAITGGKKRTMSRVEILGRFYRAGFEVVDEQFREGEFVLTVCKVAEPIDDEAPSGSPVIHLRRIGKGGKEIRHRRRGDEFPLHRRGRRRLDGVSPYVHEHRRVGGVPEHVRQDASRPHACSRWRWRGQGWFQGDAKQMGVRRWRRRDRDKCAAVRWRRLDYPRWCRRRNPQ